MIFNPEIRGFKRFFLEISFGFLKSLRAAFFALLFFVSVLIIPRDGILGMPRYDILLIVMLSVQVWLIINKLESKQEFFGILIFHFLGFAMEVFKVSAEIASWNYQDFGYTKFFGVPLFAGFMYAAIGSFMLQLWRSMRFEIHHPPSLYFGLILSLLIYINFFTHHFIGDYRIFLALIALMLYRKTKIYFYPFDKQYSCHLLIFFLFIGFLIYIAENFGTFFHVWHYPNQAEEWELVHIGKWNSWALLSIMTFSIVIFLKNLNTK
ncbi:hypothetical protein CCZ01_05410 [Helicobacter monodelphidis]|nr:hypothetical protein CCZ01_05410 [Helicobacter sp. 15-1451]